MTYLLDTDICSFAMKRRFPDLIQRLMGFAPRELKISAITAHELEFGVLRSSRSEDLGRVVEAFLGNVEALPFDLAAARHAGAIRAQLAAAGTPIGAYDLLIAAHARSLGATLVSHNQREFSRVPDLLLEDWTVC